MTIAEVKTAINEMNSGERLQLEAYLRAVNLVSSFSFREEMKRRADEMATGECFASKDVLGLHEILSAKGV